MTNAILDIPALYRPHQAQKAFHRSSARYKVLVAGRRFGKDRACIFEMLNKVCELTNTNLNKGLIPRVLAWVVAPTYPMTEQLWAELKVFIPKEMLVSPPQEVDRCLKLVGDAEIWLKTAADPERLVGVGLDMLLITEAGLVPREAWETALRPCLSSPGRAGLALINGTPKGFTWFQEMYLRGQDPLDTEVDSWHYLTSENPYIQASEIDRAKRDLPDRVFRQEYLAEFLTDTGLVFRNIDGCVLDGMLKTEPKADRKYVIGVDLGKHQDFTVIAVGDPGTRRVVDFDRFSQIDWVVQKQRIQALYQKWNRARVYLDSTGVGEPIYEDLVNSGMNIEGVHITTKEKTNLINGLIVALEQEQLRFPRIDQLITELKVFQYETTKAGNIRTTAPSGYYDDCVMALALLNKGLTETDSQAYAVARPVSFD